MSSKVDVDTPNNTNANELGHIGVKCDVLTLLTVDNSKSFYEMDYKKEQGGQSRKYWRDMMLGVNDGLVSTFLLASGVYGSGMDSRSILLTTISSMIAGAISMAGGEYVATKTQEEVMRAECAIAEKAIKEHKLDELRHLSHLLTNVGIPETESPEDDTFDVRRTILGYFDQHDEAHKAINVALAFGSVDDAERSPLVAAFVAFWLFTLGSLTTVIPFAVSDERSAALLASFIATVAATVMVGAAKTTATKTGFFMAAFENFAITCGGGAIAYGIGLGFDKHIS